MVIAALLMQRVHDAGDGETAARDGAGGHLKPLLLLLICMALHAAPVVTKVKPPNWWLPHSINPVRVLIRGTGLTGARLTATDSAIEVSHTSMNAAGTYLLDDTDPYGSP